MVPVTTLRLALTILLTLSSLGIAQAETPAPFRLGIIGLDTSHSIAFTKEFHRESIPSGDVLESFRVVAAYPQGSEDIESSASRIPGYTNEMQELGVEIVDSISNLLTKVDGVLLETNDGRRHLDQALEVFASGLPVFIDKPVGSNLAEVIAIYHAADQAGVRVFSSSSLRYSEGAQAIRSGQFGKVLGCDAYGPCHLEPTHVPLFWYGIHGVETLFTCMGRGCSEVAHTSTDDCELAVGRWSDGRIGTFRGMRVGKSGYGGTAFCEQKVAPIGDYSGYKPLVVEIAKFFRTGEVPIDSDETIELYAFMQAAHASQLKGGIPVKIADVMKVAKAEAIKRLAK